MLQIDVITLLPEILAPLLNVGVVGRAHQKGLFQTQFWNPRNYVHDAHKTVDDRPYGGGPGMIMKYAPLKSCFDDIQLTRKSRGKRIYLSPQGQVLTQSLVQKLAQVEHLVLLAGRYEGVDERLIEDEIDEEISIGDYILSGGELACGVMLDAIVRLLPDVLGDPLSAQQDSFSDGLLDYPHYTRPEMINNKKVPEILLSGDHSKIAAWRREQALLRTQIRRPDLLDK